ncbi:MAG: hypothetical protein QM493_05760 [Sulfurovum sp.]
MNEENQLKNNAVRRIIYVDASFNQETKESTISLFDQEINKLDTLKTDAPPSSSKAEIYAVLYACLYVRKNGIKDRKIHILNDNYHAVTNTKIEKLCKDMNINISWIPREINVIADKGTKQESNIKISTSNVLEFFYELIFEVTTNKTPPIKENIKDKDILMNALKNSKEKNKPYVSLGEIGKYLRSNNPTYTYRSLKQELLKYDKYFTILDDNNVKLKS